MRLYIIIFYYSILFTYKIKNQKLKTWGQQRDMSNFRAVTFSLNLIEKKNW